MPACIELERPSSIDPIRPRPAERIYRVALADDNLAILDTEKQILRSKFIIVGAFSDGESLLREAANLMPDIVLLDVSLGELNGLDIAKQLTSQHKQIQVLFVTVHEGSDFIWEAFRAGAKAYVFKSRLGCDLVPAIEAVRCNKVFISRRMFARDPVG